MEATEPVNNGVRAGKAFGGAGFLLLMLMLPAFPYGFLGDGVYNLVVPKMFFLRLAAAAFFISLAFHLAFEPGIFKRFLGNTWPVLAWLGWQAASFIWTKYAWATTAAVIDDACVAACMLGAVIFFTGNKAGRFAEIAFALATATAGVIFLFSPGHAPFVNENPGGMFFALAAIAAAGRLCNAIAAKKRASNAGIVIMAAFVLFCAACVIKSHSRGAALALVIGAAVLLVVAWKERMIALTALLVLMLAFLGLILAAPALKEKMLGEKYGSTIWTRVFIWRGALQMIYEKPVLGRGGGAFGAANVEYQPVESYMHAGIKSPAQYAHNFYLETAAETGAIGVAMFLGVIVFILHKARRAMARDAAKRWYIAGLVGAAFVALAHGGVDIVMSLPSTQIFFWLCAAAILGREMRTEVSNAKTGAARWTAAMLLSACAVIIWALVFSGELPREVEFTRLYRGEALLNYQVDAPYETSISLFTRVEKARDASDAALRLAGEPGSRDLAEAGRLYAEAAAELRYVQSLAPDMYKAEMHLGFVLIKLGNMRKDGAMVAQGCGMLVEHMKHNPFNIPEKTAPSENLFGISASLHTYGEDTEGIVAALALNLKDPALKRELRDIIANALTLVSEGGDAVPREVLYAAGFLQDYIKFLANDPDLIEYR